MSKHPLFQMKEEWYQRPVGTFNGHVVERCEAAHQLVIDKYTLPFTLTEYRLALLLLKHYGTPVSFEQLVEGHFDARRDRKPLFKHITHVRKALEPLLNVRIKYDSLCLNGGYIMLPVGVLPEALWLDRI